MAEVSDRALSLLQARWEGRDRIVAVVVADYTDLALGLGETMFGLAAFACSSANVSNAHAKASSMGHAAASMEVQGSCGEDFHRMLGMVGRAWSRPSKWPYRYLDIHASRMGGAELGLMLVRGDLRDTVPDVKPAADELRRLISMYGVESSESSKTILIREESIKIAEIQRHPSLWPWLARCVESEG